MTIALREHAGWDSRLAAGATVDDLDLLALRELLVQMDRWDPETSIDHWLDPDQALGAFMPSLCGREPLTGVVRPRNFAILLCGREPQRFVPGAWSIFSAYPGTDRAVDFNERQELGGTVIAQARRLIQLLDQQAVGLTDKTGDGLDNVVKYPTRALREAVINALVHRDYIAMDPVRVVAYIDRIDIWSPGALDAKVDPEAFTRGEARATWRNQALAWVFIKLGLAQSEGQGIPAIRRAMAQAGCPEPQFTITGGSVACVLPAHRRHGRMGELLAHADGSLLDLAATRRLIVTWLSLDDHDEARAVLLRALAAHPEWATEPSLGPIIGRLGTRG